MASPSGETSHETEERPTFMQLGEYVYIPTFDEASNNVSTSMTRVKALHVRRILRFNKGNPQDGC